MLINKRRAGAKVSIVLLFVLMFLFLATSVASAATVTPGDPGDVNNDGRINVQDISLVMRHVLALPPLLTAGQVAIADVDGNGVVNVLDVTLIMRRSLGLIAEFPVTPLQVASITAVNPRQVEVVFRRAISEAVAENPLHYEVYRQGALGANIFGLAADGAVAELQADGRTVLLTLNDGQALVNGTTTNRVVVKTGVGLAADHVNSAVPLNDVTVPTLLSVRSIATRTIELTFSEPVRPVAPPPFPTITNVTLADGAVTIGLDLAGASIVESRRQIIIPVGADLVAGRTYTLAVAMNNNLRDYVDYPVVPVSRTFTHTPVTTAPSVSAAALTERTLRLTFDRPVSLTTAGANVRFRYAFNAPGAVFRTSADMDGAATPFAAAVVPGSGGTRYDITFATPMTPGSGTVYINYATDSNAAGRIVDGFGNVLPNNTSASFTVTPDVTRPTVTLATVVNPTTIEVTFSEPVTGATSTLNYTLTNPLGAPVAITSAVLQTGTLSTYRLTVGTMAAGGRFTLAVDDDIRDLSVMQNRLVPFSTVLTVADTVRPTVVSVGHSTDRTRLFVQFSEPMGPSAVLLANYRTGTTYPGAAVQTPLPAGTMISQMGSLVTIAFPAPLAVGQVSLVIAQVADLAGNTLLNLQTVMELDPAVYNPIVTDVRFLTRSQLRFTVDRHLSGTIVPGRITTTGVSATATAIHSSVNNADGTATVTVNFADNTFQTDLQGVVALVLGDGALTDLNGLTSTEPTTVNPPFNQPSNWDYIAPAIVENSVITEDNNGNGRIDRVIVGFTEDLSIPSVFVTDFTVAGYAASAVYVYNAATTVNATTVGSTVTIHLVEGTNPDTAAVPAVTLVGSVQDNSPQGNAFGPRAAIAAVDRARPVIVGVALTAGTGSWNATTERLTLTFSEPVVLPNVSQTADVVNAITGVVPQVVFAGGSTVTSTGNNTHAITLTIGVAPLTTGIAPGANVPGTALAGLTDVALNNQAVSTHPGAVMP